MNNRTPSASPCSLLLQRCPINQEHMRHAGHRSQSSVPTRVPVILSTTNANTGVLRIEYSNTLYTVQESGLRHDPPIKLTCPYSTHRVSIWPVVPCEPVECVTSEANTVERRRSERDTCQAVDLWMRCGAVGVAGTALGRPIRSCRAVPIAYTYMQQ